MPGKRFPVEERFWAKVEVVGECWLWRGATRKHGYGEFAAVSTRKATPVSAYRWAYERYVGPMPEGLIPDHLCRTPACVRMDHIEPVTWSENFLRSHHPKMIARRTGLCTAYGHRLIARKDGRGNVCRECKNMKRRKSWGTVTPELRAMRKAMKQLSLDDAE